MRWRMLVIVAARAAAPSAHAAKLSVSKGLFSPDHATVRLHAQLTVPRQVGLSLVARSGRSLGWIVPPALVSTIDVAWDGRIAGRRVPDGVYRLRLVYRSAILATSTVRVDTRPARLLYLHVDNGASRFAGDNRLLTTISPNGDKFRDSANVRFVLSERATVTM